MGTPEAGEAARGKAAGSPRVLMPCLESSESGAGESQDSGEGNPARIAMGGGPVGPWRPLHRQPFGTGWWAAAGMMLREAGWQGPMRGERWDEARIALLQQATGLLAAELGELARGQLAHRRVWDQAGAAAVRQAGRTRAERGGCGAT